MLRTSIHTVTALALTLFTPACDDPSDAEFGADPDADADEDEDEAEAGAGHHRFRCAPQPCINPPLGNTNWAGENPMDTVTHNAWRVPTQLSNGKYMQITGATCGTVGSPIWIYKFNATSHGELVFYKSSTGGEAESNKVRGTAVAGCRFHAEFSQYASLGQATAIDIWVDLAAQVTRADGSTGYKYMMTVAGLNTNLPKNTQNRYPTCYDNDDAPGNYWLTVRPGLALATNTWSMTSDSTKQSWVCAAGAFGHFALKDVDVQDISNATVATTEGRAWGLYHDGASHTWVGNPIRIHHPTIAGYDTAPDPCGNDFWYREALWGNGGLVCRGSSESSWTDEINRNAWLQGYDWDNDSSVSSVGVCSGTPSHDFETYAQCYMNGSTQVCPASNAC